MYDMGTRSSSLMKSLLVHHPKAKPP